MMVGGERWILKVAPRLWCLDLESLLFRVSTSLSSFSADQLNLESLIEGVATSLILPHIIPVQAWVRSVLGHHAL